MEEFDFHSLLIHLLSPKGATLTARIWFVSLRFVVLPRNVFIRWSICLCG